MWDGFQWQLSQATQVMQDKFNEQKDETRKRTDRNDNDKRLCLKETTIHRAGGTF